jgi:hypothetical protein
LNVHQLDRNPLDIRDCLPVVGSRGGLNSPPVNYCCSLDRLAINGHDIRKDKKCMEGHMPPGAFGTRVDTGKTCGSGVGISRKPGNIRDIFEVLDLIFGIDLEDRRRRDLGQT